MNTPLLDKKTALIDWLSSLEDEAVIEKLNQIKQEVTEDWWSNTTSEEQNSIENGISDAENSKLSPHSSARKLYEKWL